jgi:hypothetical protein
VAVRPSAPAGADPAGPSGSAGRAAGRGERDHCLGQASLVRCGPELHDDALGPAGFAGRPRPTAGQGGTADANRGPLP